MSDLVFGVIRGRGLNLATFVTGGTNGAEADGSSSDVVGASIDSPTSSKMGRGCSRSACWTLKKNDFY